VSRLAIGGNRRSVAAMKRVTMILLLGLCATQGAPCRARAEEAKPVAEPAVSPSSAKEEPEADYLALADTPLFLPRSYFYWGTPVGPRGERTPLVFGLEYALHLPIFNDIRDQLLLGKHWAGAVTLSFEGALRMLATDSDPVRMPSYRPSFSGQLFYTWYREAPLTFGLRSSLYHYSNGQERCAFDETLSDLSGACLKKVGSTRDLPGELNRKSGNFSTSGALFELHARIHKLNANGLSVAHLSAGFGYSRNFKTFLGSMDAPTRALYGSDRLEGNLEGKRRMGWASLTLRSAIFHYLADDARVPSTAGLVEIVVAPYWLSGIGLFARYYGGRDFYNAFFVDRLQQLTTGIAWDGERPLKFKREDERRLPASGGWTRLAR